MYTTTNVASFVSGGTPNPNWDRSNHENVEFMTACFGYHLILNLAFMVITYYIIFLLLRRKSKENFLYKGETEELLKDSELGALN